MSADLALFDYQQQGIDETYRAVGAGRRRPMLQLPTGAGKTETAVKIIQRALAKGRRAVFVVPAIELIDQTVDRLAKYGVHCVGVIQADHPGTDRTQPVQVASVQTLSRRMLPETDLVIVDEAHQVFKIITTWMEERTTLPFIGLSATPWSKGLGKHYTDLIRPVSLLELIERKRLTPFRAYAPSHPDLTGVKTVAGDYDEAGAAAAMDKPQLTADIVSTWLAKGENRPTLCFAVNRAHARSLADGFERAGVSTAYIDGFTERDDRKMIARAFAAGRVKVVVNVGVLTTGVDWDVRCIILARPTKSEILYVQIIGRGLRTADGKEDCLILDHSDTTLTLGFVTDINHEALDEGKRKETKGRAPKAQELKVPKECPSCHALKPAGVHTCPECGFAPEQRQDIETRNGELAHVAGGKPKEDRETKQRFWSGLLWYVDNRGKSQGWASHRYKDRFGVWPRGLRDAPKQPGPDVHNWVRAGNIKYAKAMEKKRKAGGENAAA
jgi:DNA repair protein RadD